MVREIERAGIPVAYITAMSLLAKQMGNNRVITGTKLPHPCGDPNVPEEADFAIRREIIKCSLEALQTDVDGPTIVEPNIVFTTG